MPRTLVVVWSFAVSLTLTVPALLSPAKAIAGPPEGVSAKMVFDDVGALQGPCVWQAVEVLMGGKAAVEPEMVILFFGKDTFVWKNFGTVLFKGTYHLDVSRKPKAIDMRMTFTPLGEVGEFVWPGIYRLDGDILKLGVRAIPDEGRPKEFASKTGSHDWLFTFKREKP